MCPRPSFHETVNRLAQRQAAPTERELLDVAVVFNVPTAMVVKAVAEYRDRPLNRKARAMSQDPEFLIRLKQSEIAALQFGAQEYLRTRPEGVLRPQMQSGLDALDSPWTEQRPAEVESR